MDSIVITGPTGTIGLALINKCIEEGVKVYAVCRPNSSRTDHIPKSGLVHVIECDISELRWLPEMISDTPTIFYHMAWVAPAGEGRNDVTLQWQNIGYALDAVEAAAKLRCRTFIGTGSQAEYGRVEGKLKPEMPAYPENGYGMAKLCAGQMTRLRCEQLGLRHIWTRILSVYGPGDSENTMIMSAMNKLLNQEVPKLTEGEQMWDYLYSKDAARAMYLLGEQGISGKTYCIGSGVAQPLREYICCMRDIIAPGCELGFGEVPYSDKQVMYLCADIEELTRDTGFTPRYSFERGIIETIEWNCAKAVKISQ